jgi:hypothetical protein
MLEIQELFLCSKSKRTFVSNRKKIKKNIYSLATKSPYKIINGRLSHYQAIKSLNDLMKSNESLNAEEEYLLKQMKKDSKLARQEFG